MKRVLDQNRLSDRSLIEGCNDTMVVADIAFFENIKSDGWRQDLKRTFEVLHEMPERVEVTHAVGPLLRRELKTGNPIESAIDQFGTRAFREILSSDDYVSKMAPRIEELRKQPLQPIANLESDRQNMNDSMSIIRRFMPPDLLSKFRAQAQKRNEFPLKAFAPSFAESALATVPEFLKSMLLNQTAVERLSQPDSIWFRSLLTHLIQAFYYLKNGTALQMNDSKLLNDMVDYRYAVIASFFDELVTDDIKLGELYDAVTESVHYAETA